MIEINSESRTVYECIFNYPKYAKYREEIVGRVKKSLGKKSWFKYPNTKGLLYCFAAKMSVDEAANFCYDQTIVDDAFTHCRAADRLRFLKGLETKYEEELDFAKEQHSVILRRIAETEDYLKTTSCRCTREYCCDYCMPY